MSKLGLVLDSTQISDFLECPRLWHYKNVRRLQLVAAKPRRRVMDVGSYGHKLLEIFYYTLAEGKSRSSAIERSFAYRPDDVCSCGHMKHVHKTSSDIPELSDGEGCKFRKCECEEFSPVEALVSKKDEEKLRKRLLDYFATYTNNDIRPYSPESVEVGFSHELFSSYDRTYVLEGKIDILGKHAGLDSFTDHKFQERKKNLYNKSIQFRNYALVTGFSFAFINYIRLAEEVGPDTFKREIINFTKPEMILWKKRLIKVYDRIARFLADSETPGFWTSDDSEPNWSACSGKFGYHCDYTTLCEEINTPVVANKIDQLYQIGKIWKPW